MFTNKVLVLFLGLFFSASGCFAEEENSLSIKIDAYITPLVKAEHFSGTILIANGDVILYERSFGLSNRELGVKVNSETRFAVGSLTKVMTRVITYQLFEEGVLKPEDTLDKWFPDFPQWKKITVDMLLKHEAGFVSHVSTDLQQTEPLEASDIIELAKGTDLLFEPGSDSSYSSAGYSVLARVLELATGIAYEDLLKKYVFEKAGMENSQHPTGYSLIKNKASSYQFGGDGELKNAPLKNYSSLVGSGSVFSTAQDLLRFMTAVVDGTYGDLATSLLVKEDGISWAGLTGGYRTFTDYNKESGFYVIGTGNVLSGAVDLLQWDLIRIAKGEEVSVAVIPDHQAVSVDPEILRRYEGKYQFRPGVNFSFSVDRGEARMGSWILIPTSETTFFSPQDYSIINIIFSDDGTVERMDWISGDFVAPMPLVAED